jgi:DNA-binding CsgD family transcriptional regulator
MGAYVRYAPLPYPPRGVYGSPMTRTAATTQSTTSVVVGLAEARNLTQASGDAARVTARTLMRGTATAAERAAHALPALVAAGLVGDVTPLPYPLTLAEDGTVNERLHARTWTPQRLAVLGCFGEGLSYTQTATRLHLNVATVKSHTGNIYRLLGVASKVEAIVEGVRYGLLPAPADPPPPPTPPRPHPPPAPLPRRRGRSGRRPRRRVAHRLPRPPATPRPHQGPGTPGRSVGEIELFTLFASNRSVKRFW